MPSGPSTYPIKTLKTIPHFKHIFHMCTFKRKEEKLSSRLSRKTDLEETFYAWLSLTNKTESEKLHSAP